MAQAIYRGSAKEWCEKNMGRGGAIPLGKKLVSEPQTSSEKPAHLVNSLEEFDSQLGMDKEIAQIFQEAKEQMSGDSPSGQTGESSLPTGEKSEG